ncbi:putative sensor histidine kinase pdtaS [Methanosarcinales archaeon]|nr:PAS domain S-box protein [Candidatus Methanoperedens sp.]CAG1000852.1 putative sensor histidine kinase pdtaS [Methanosarcinales archaeon]
MDEKQKLKLKSLSHIASIDNTLEFDKILPDILKITCETMRAHSGTILLVDEATDELRMVAGYGLGQDYPERVHKAEKKAGTSLKHSPFGIVLKTGKSYIVPNVLEEPKGKPLLHPGKVPGFSSIFTPMIKGLKVIGLLNIYMAQVHQFTEEEIDFTTIAASQAASVVHNARISKRLENKINELEESRQKLSQQACLSVLGSEVSFALNHGGTLQETLNLCAESMVRNLDAALARIWTLNKGKNMLEMQASAGMYTHTDGFHSRIPVGKFKIGLIARERIPHLTNEISSDPRIHDKEWAKGEGIAAFAGYPLIIEEELVGVMGIFARKPLTDFTVSALASVADNIALCITRKQAEEEACATLVRLREEKAKTEAIIAAIGDGVSTQDTDFKILYQNKIVKDWMGDHAGEYCYRVYEQKDHICKGCPVAISFQDGKVHRAQRSVPGKNGTSYFDITASPLRDSTGKIIAGIEIVRDITESKISEEALKQSEEKYRILIENSQDGIFIIQDAKIEFANETFARMAGCAVDQIIGKDFQEFISPEDFKMVADRYKKRQAGEDVPSEYEFYVLDNRKNRILVRMNVGLITYRGRIASMGTIKDITRSKQAELEYKTLLKTALDGFYVVDTRGCILDVNDSYCHMIGYSRDELLNMNIKDVDAIDTEEVIGERVSRIMEIGWDRFETRHRRKDGRIIEIEASVNYINAGIGKLFVFMRDITERKEAGEKIEESLKEKEILLREIHHRVKNNMQIISSLLKLQAGTIKDEKYLDIFKESQNRILAMSLVHETLYRSEGFSRINARDYITSISNGIVQSYRDRGNNISMNLNIEDIALGIDSSIPCGLIINELITNSLKHAFPDRRNGEIKIVLTNINGHEYEYELIVSDNGIGLPEDIDFRKTETLGLHLVSMLAEDQLSGTIDLYQNNGTEFKIRFKDGK